MALRGGDIIAKKATKTTTCENLGIGLAMEGKKVLLVDVDPQGSLTISMGWQQPDELPTTLSTLMQKAMNDQPIQPGEGILHHAEGVDLIPANIELAGMEVALVNSMNREKMLKQVLDSAKREYDYILLDCTPSLGMLTVNALAAADTTLIPMQAQYLSAKGLEQLLQTIGKVRRQISETVELAVQQREPALSIQIWKSYVDEMGVSVISPSGRQAGPFYEFLGAQRYILGDTELLIYYGEPKPYSVKQEIYLSLLPGKQYIESGVWKIVLTPGRIVDGEYQMWLPTQTSLNMGTAFLQPNSMSTLTIPSTASLAVTVAAYDARTFSYADFSGRGPAGMYEGENVLKPDIAAPGVRVTAPVPGGGYQSFSGTSFAAPFVTGSAALLMEWGIVRGNDPYLYGEKVKAYLRKGAKQLAGYERWPNALLGYGALCVRDSLPGLGSS